jgi:hypothetical protein
MSDLLIIGAGPIGLAAGIEAKRAGLQFQILEAGTVCQSLVEYPIGMRFYSPADELAIGGYPFPTPHDEKPTRELALTYYRKVASAENLPIRTYQRVVRLEPQWEGFAVHAACTLHGAPATYRTRCVLVCTGVWGKARRLQVEGAELQPHLPKNLPQRRARPEPPYLQPEALQDATAVDPLRTAERCSIQPRLVPLEKFGILAVGINQPVFRHACGFILLVLHEAVGMARAWTNNLHDQVGRAIKVLLGEASRVGTEDNYNIGFAGNLPTVGQGQFHQQRGVVYLA